MNTISHIAADYADRDRCSLKDDCVHVTFTRDEHPLEPKTPGVFTVTIHPDDRPMTFERSVCRALEAKGFEVILDGRGANGIMVARKFFRPAAGYKMIKRL